MVKKSSAHYQREFRKRLREKGFVKKEVWILPENANQLRALEKQLRMTVTTTTSKGVEVMTKSMNKNTTKWTTIPLYEALNTSDLFKQGEASIELIEGIEPSFQIIMHEYGDLPIFVTVSGEQIMTESLLWPASQVRDKNSFHEVILRSHKYFPLSSISLDKEPDGEDYYQMFGALHATSSLNEVLFEIDTLASNVIQATEAYNEYFQSTTL